MVFLDDLEKEKLLTLSWKSIKLDNIALWYVDVLI